jgi:hypothetical protein
VLLECVAVVQARTVRQLWRRQRSQVETSTSLARLIEDLLRFGVEVAVPEVGVWTSGRQGSARQEVA